MRAAPQASLAFMFTLVASLGGCGALQGVDSGVTRAVPESPLSPPPPLIEHGMTSPSPSTLPRSTAADRGPLSLVDVLELVAAQNADLLAARKGVDAVAARRIDAGKPSNPEASVYAEDLGEQRSRLGTRDTQTTLQLGQAIPLTGKLGHQQAVARGEQTVAEREYEARRVEILAGATRIFIALVVAQQREALAKDQLGLVERLFAAEKAQVEAGQIAPFELSRVVSAQAEARLRLNETRRDILALRQRLASYWGADGRSLREVKGDLERFPRLPALPTLVARLNASPEIARNEAEIALRRSGLALEQDKAIPDVTLQSGVRRHEDEGNYAFVVGAAVPLNIYSSNQSGIVEAERRREQAEVQLEASQNRLGATVRETYEKLVSTEEEIETIRKTLIPSSEQAVMALREGYDARKFRLSELLLAEQSLTNLRDKLLTTLGNYHQGYVDLEQLLGTSLRDPPAREKR